MIHKLDLKDKKIIYQLDINSRASLVEIAKNVGLSKEVVFNRINNLVENNVINKFLTVPATYRLGLTGYKVYIRLASMKKNNLNNLIKYLQENKDVYWATTCRGRWDFIFGIWSKNLQDFFITYNDILNQFSTYIQEKELSISVENFQFNRRWLFDTKEPIKTFDFGETKPPIQINELNEKILKILANNSRAKLTEIAKELGVDSKVVAYRIKEMEKKEVINGYKVNLNSSVIGFHTYKAFIFYKNITEDRKKALLEYCKNLKNSINCVITFAKWDLELMMEVLNDEEFYNIMDILKEEFSDIIDYYESILITEENEHIYLIKENKA